MERALQQYIELYEAHQSTVEAYACAPLNTRRAAALERLQKYGLPTKKQEAYRYFDVEKVFAPDYGLNLKRLLPADDALAAYAKGLPQMGGPTVVVWNDCVVPFDGAAAGVPEGILIDSFSRIAAKNPDFIDRFYHRLAGREADVATDLNTLFAQDGVLIYLPQNARLEQPLQIATVCAGTADLLSCRRVLVVAEAGSRAEIILCSHAQGEQHHLALDVVEAIVGEGADISLYNVENSAPTCSRFLRVYGEQRAASRLRLLDFTVRNGFSHTKTDVELLGEGARVEANGAVIADERRRVENHLLIRHTAPACESDLLYKYVLDGKSVGAFAGKVLVSPGAQQTISEETNSNLCVSDGARMYSQPMLEIYADDVKCKHGSTVGKFDDAALFYMQQRGIPEREARQLLQYAFVNEVLLRVSLPQLRERLEGLVEQHFSRQTSKCKQCQIADVCGKRDAQPIN